MKAMLLVPLIYSLADMLHDGFLANDSDVVFCDYREVVSRPLNRLYEKTTGLPRKITRQWKQKYYRIINKAYLVSFESEKPDLVVIYNNQFVYPDTIRAFKKKAKVIFCLGDNPLWSRTFDHNLSILRFADLVLCPDSHWQFELEMVGIPNVVNDHIGYSKKRFYPLTIISEDIRQKYESDLLFVGNIFPGSLGHKRAMFLNSFAGMNLKLFGTKGWINWFSEFPKLEPHFTLISEYIKGDELNQAINCTKIYPVDQNTGITNGIHARVFEAIGAGVLPLVEWRKDIDSIFGDLLPSVKHYGEAREMAAHYLKSETLRKEKIIALQKHIENKYNPKLYVKRILERFELNG